jgi:hypothetical protein
MLRYLLFSLALISLSLSGFAQEVISSVPGESVFDAIAKALDGAMAQAGIIAVALDFILRFIPSKKPLSVLHVVGLMAKKVGDLLVAFGMLLDKILPQNVSDGSAQGKLK